MKPLTSIFLAFIILFSAEAQQLKLITAAEISIPTDNPWGLIYFDDYFWISDALNGNIIKMHRYEQNITFLKAPGNRITGLTFEDRYLWVLSNEWDTIAFPDINHVKASLFKLDTTSGDVLDMLYIPYYVSPIPFDSLNQPSGEDPFADYKFLLGISYFDSSLFVSFNGGWGPCMFRVKKDNQISEFCCAHPSGLETIENELWTVRHNFPVNVCNMILPIEISDSGSSENWNRAMEYDFFASDLAWDGKNFWLCDPVEKKIKRMAIDTIPCFSVDSLEIFPENPTDEDEIRVVCYSTFTSGDCNMVNYKLTFADSDICIQAYHEVGLLDYICHSADTINIGKLPPGENYILQYNLTAINLHCGAVSDSITFSVRDTTIGPKYITIFPENPAYGDSVGVIFDPPICNIGRDYNFITNIITINANLGQCGYPCPWETMDTLYIGMISPGTYTLVYYLLDNCSHDPDDSLLFHGEFIFEVKESVGITLNKSDMFIIYPNPAHDEVFIEFNQPVGKLELEIYNLSGQRILNRSCHNLSSIQLDLSGLKNGMYFLKLRTDKGISSQKLIIY